MDNSRPYDPREPQGQQQSQYPQPSPYQNLEQPQAQYPQQQPPPYQYPAQQQQQAQYQYPAQQPPPTQYPQQPPYQYPGQQQPQYPYPGQQQQLQYPGQQQPQYPYQGQAMVMEPQKSWVTSLLLCYFLGYFGIHRFYTGHIVSGVLQLLTGGGFGIWVLIDIIMIVTGEFKDKSGRPLYHPQVIGGNKSWVTTALLCMFLGYLGVHRFYTGHIAIGVVQLLTGGGFGIWVLIDLILIFTDSLNDSTGMRLTRM